MLLLPRRSIIGCLWFFSAIVAAFTLLTFWLIFSKGSLPLTQEMGELKWLSFLKSIQITTPARGLLISLSTFVFFPVVIGIAFGLLFKRPPPAEIFFFVLFILSWSFQGIRVILLFPDFTASSPLWGLWVTRISYAARLWGVLCFFACSLYALGEKAPKRVELPLLLTVMLSLATGLGLPVDQTTLLPSQLYQIGERQGVILLFLALEILTIINFLRTCVSSSREKKIASLLGALLTIVGAELLFSSPHSLLLSLSAMGSLLGGNFLFLWRSYYRHLRI